MVLKLTPEMRTEIVVIYTASKSVRETAGIFSQRYPDRDKLSASTVSKIFNKFKATGSIHDLQRSGRPKSSFNEEKSIGILAKVRADPHTNVRQMAQEAGISTGSVRKILKTYKFHPYKMQILHHLEPGDNQKRLDFCHDMLQTAAIDPTFPYNILWSDESMFTLNGIMNKQNYR